MKSKTINAVLNKKLDDWAESVDDIEIQNIIKDKSIITGGCIASMLLGEPVNDYDVYFKDYDSCLRVTEYYVNKFSETNNLDIFIKSGDELFGIHTDDDMNMHKLKQDELRDKGMIDEDNPRIRIVIKSAGVAQAVAQAKESDRITDVVDPDLITEPPIVAPESEDKPKYQPIFMSANAITLSNKIQIINRFYGSPEEIHDNYDFTHCTNYWESNESNENTKSKLVLNPLALECLLSRTLLYQGSKYPLCSIIRTRKFIKRGWNINAGQYLKMAFQISKLDLTDLDVLEDQLIGVDTVYFMNLIDHLKETKANNPDMTMDSTYVTEIIDKIFG